MKKLSLKELGINTSDILQKQRLKTVFGGYGYGVTGCSGGADWRYVLLPVTGQVYGTHLCQVHRSSLGIKLAILVAVMDKFFLKTPCQKVFWHGVFQIVFLITVINFSYAQENSSGRVLYNVFEGNYTNEVEPNPNPFRLGVNGLNDDDFAPRSILLEFNKNSSHSRLTEESENTENRWSKFKNASLELLGETFYDSHSKEILNMRQELEENHIIVSNADSLKWTLTKDKKEILGYICNKVTSKRNYTNVSGKSFSNNYETVAR